jgi:hypothetical protein
MYSTTINNNNIVQQTASHSYVYSHSISHLLENDGEYRDVLYNT